MNVNSDKIFVAGCIENGHDDNFQCSDDNYVKTTAFPL